MSQQHFTNKTKLGAITYDSILNVQVFFVLEEREKGGLAVCAMRGHNGSKRISYRPV